LRTDPQRGSRTYQSSIVKEIKRRGGGYEKVGGGFQDKSTKEEQDLLKIDSDRDEEEEEVDMKKLEADLRTDPQRGSRTTKA
jgi:hypothetical protein